MKPRWIYFWQLSHRNRQFWTHWYPFNNRVLTDSQTIWLWFNYDSKFDPNGQKLDTIWILREMNSKLDGKFSINWPSDNSMYSPMIVLKNMSLHFGQQVEILTAVLWNFFKSSKPCQCEIQVNSNSCPVIYFVMGNNENIWPIWNGLFVPILNHVKFYIF